MLLDLVTVTRCHQMGCALTSLYGGLCMSRFVCMRSLAEAGRRRESNMPQESTDP